MARVLLVQPSLQPPGGGNGVAAWMVEALRDTHEITLLCWGEIDLGAINRYFGTTLQAGDFTAQRISPLAHRLLRAAGLPLETLRRGLLLRRTKRLAPHHDVVITAHNEADFGVPGIQYIHYPWAYFPRPQLDARWYHRWRGGLEIYYAVALGLARFSFERVKRNLTLVNSNWTGARYQEIYQSAFVTLYPPVFGAPATVDWGQREHGFVCLGRFAPEKELLKVIDIIDGVRQRGHAVQLHLAGGGNDLEYLRQLRAYAAPRSAWLSLHENLSRDAVGALLATQRFGIHGMREEHFGMAVAESLKAGCVPFVPNAGGQVEIVGDEPLLRYENSRDAIDKIDTLLRDPERLQTIRARLAVRAELFSTQRFMTQFRTLVDGFLENNRAAR